jgi:hypothetical protein
MDFCNSAIVFCDVVMLSAQLSTTKVHCCEYMPLSIANATGHLPLRVGLQAVLACFQAPITRVLN